MTPTPDPIAAIERAVMEAIISCSHEIDHDGVLLKFSERQPGHNAYNQLVRRVRAALSALVEDQPVAVKALVRHKKRGSEYEVIGIGKMQAEHWRERNPNTGQATFGQCDQLVDMREVMIYRSVDDGSLWVRPRGEFEDGRFEPVASPVRSALAPAPEVHLKGYRNPNWKTDDVELESALDAFWNAAYQQGWERRGHDDRAGTAQKADDELRRVIYALSRKPSDAQTVGDGSTSDAKGNDHGA